MTQLWPTYAAWVSGVRDFLNVADFTDTQIQVFLALAQVRLNRELRGFHIEKVATITATSSQTDLSSAIPDFAKIRLVNEPGGVSLRTMAINEIIDAYSTSANITGDPRYYCIAEGQLYLYPPPASTGVQLEVRYYKAVTPISPTVDTNEYTEFYSDALLYAACLESATYLEDDERVPMWENKYMQAAKGAYLEGNAIKMGSTPLVREVRAS